LNAINRPQKTAKQRIGATGQIAVAKKATAVVDVVNNMALAALVKATDAISAVVPSGFSSLAFFHLSTATNTSSAPRAAATKNPMKFRNGKLCQSAKWIQR
jgi:hypothetical protein